MKRDWLFYSVKCNLEQALTKKVVKSMKVWLRETCGKLTVLPDI